MKTAFVREKTTKIEKQSNTAYCGLWSLSLAMSALAGSHCVAAMPHRILYNCFGPTTVSCIALIFLRIPRHQRHLACSVATKHSLRAWVASATRASKTPEFLKDIIDGGHGEITSTRSSWHGQFKFRSSSDIGRHCQLLRLKNVCV